MVSKDASPSSALVYALAIALHRHSYWSMMLRIRGASTEQRVKALFRVEQLDDRITDLMGQMTLKEVMMSAALSG
jgi:hypothetical protein